MKTLRIAAIALLLVTLPALTSAKPDKRPSKQFIAGLFNHWNAALKTGSPEKVAALYCEPGGVLIPTVSNQVRSNRHEIDDYFQHFLELKPVGHIDHAYIRILGPDTAINSGLYTFHLTRDGKPEVVHARYTFVYQKRHGRWCIMEHHSSVMPENGGSSPH